MKIYEVLGLDIEKKEVIAVVGGGGKTTTIFQLGEELKNLNKKVLITTTTAMYNPREEYDYYFLGNIRENFIPNNRSITIFGKNIEKGKLKGLFLPKIDEIIHRGIFDFILIEADGAKGKPIKAPNHYEPVISRLTTKTLGIIGLDCFGKKIEDIVHRPEIFIEIVEKSFQDIVDKDAIIKLILSNRGLFKESQGERLLLLNKADNKEDIIRGKKIRRLLLEEGFKGKAIVGDIKKRSFY